MPAKYTKKFDLFLKVKCEFKPHAIKVDNKYEKNLAIKNGVNLRNNIHKKKSTKKTIVPTKENLKKYFFEQISISVSLNFLIAISKIKYLFIQLITVYYKE